MEGRAISSTSSAVRWISGASLESIAHRLTGLTMLPGSVEISASGSACVRRLAHFGGDDRENRGHVRRLWRAASTAALRASRSVWRSISLHLP